MSSRPAPPKPTHCDNHHCTAGPGGTPTEFDWTGKDRRREPQPLEDGGYLCRACIYETERHYD